MHLGFCITVGLYRIIKYMLLLFKITFILIFYLIIFKQLLFILFFNLIIL